MNPYELTGPSFLGLFFLSNVISVSAASIYRSAQSQERVEQAAKDSLDAFELAYLSGKQAQMIEAALASLLQSETLKIDLATYSKTSFTVKPELNKDRHPVVLETLSGLLCADRSDLAKAVNDLKKKPLKSIEPIRKKLEKLKLIHDKNDAFSVSLCSCAIVGLPLLLGVPKLFIGMSHHKPVGFLLIGVFACAGIAMLFLCKQPHQTKSGHAFLEKAKASQSELKISASVNSPLLSSSDAALAAGLFGVTVFSLGPLYDLRKSMSPQSGSYSSCGGGGGSCGGGGCGGGCGGCGG